VAVLALLLGGSPAVAATTTAAGPEYLVVHYRAGEHRLIARGDVEAGPVEAPFAGEDTYGRFAWVRLAPGAGSVEVSVVGVNGVEEAAATVDPSRTAEVWLRPGDARAHASRADATGVITVHYGRSSGGWGLHLWGDGVAPEARTDWAAPRRPDGTDAFGAYWNVPVGDPAKAFTFIVHSGDTKDPNADLALTPANQGEAWIRPGDAGVHATRAAAENTAVLHYRRADGDYAGWGLHVWDGAANPTSWTAPLLPERMDAYGAEFRVPLAGGAAALAYIVHKGDTKDLPDDQFLDLAGVGSEVWLLSGQPRYLLPMSLEAPDTDITKQRAVWLDRDTVAVRLDKGTDHTDGRRYELRYDPAGRLSIVDGQVVVASPGDKSAAARGGGALRLQPAGALTEAQRQKYPHLWAYTAFNVEPADHEKVIEALRSQQVFAEFDAQDDRPTFATGVQIPGALDDIYWRASTERLGPQFHNGRPSLAIWAPTARTVELELFDTPTGSATTKPMRRDDATGVWKVTGERAWSGKYYKFRVTAWQPAAQAVVTASVTDPYSVALAANSTHSQLVDLNDPALAPPGWRGLHKPALPARPQIQEVHVRDFSVADESVPAEHRGTYLAFADQGSDGMKHLNQLARAGANYVHLLPVFDIATIPERRAEQVPPPCDLAALPPDSDQQQACVGQVKDADGYNWGYDPFHYNVPEGSYATNPDGPARTRELRQAVSGLNHAGLRVVVDVVYNHTPAAGTDKYSVLDQIVPGYYQRLLDDGTVANSTCCANTAPENMMMGKLVVDSVVLWARQYKVDGFRFDLMGHHPKANLLAVRKALDELTIQRDGVDGKRILLYGEGWDFGEVSGNQRFEQATQPNMAGTGIATFSDRLRDAVRGGGPFDPNPRLQGFGSGLYTDPNGDPVNGSLDDQRNRLMHYQDVVQLGLAGNLRDYSFTASDGRTVTGEQVDYNGSPAGYTAAPAEAVTYVDAHDNEILYDALAFKLPQSTSPADRSRMQTLALSMTTLGQGTGFVAGGSDLLRSKSLDRNSFNSGDWFNAIRWNCKAGNGFGHGLPPAADNAEKWEFSKPLLADPALKPGCGEIAGSGERYADLLAVRWSSPVFSLPTAGEVQRRLAFPLAGPAATPGVITMTLDARGVDRRWKSIVVVFNATPQERTQRLDALANARIALHPVQAKGADATVKRAHFDAGTFTVPARTVAVFVQT
jgi:pullulanase-type alpha-1,6-glucosidase